MLKSVVARLSLLVVLALGAGAAAGVIVVWPEQRLWAALAFLPLAVATIIVVKRLAQTLVRSIEQISDVLGRLAKGEFDAKVPELGSFEELRRMSRRFAEFVAEVTRVLTSVRAAANALVAASSEVSSASQALSQGPPSRRPRSRRSPPTWSR